MLDLPSAETNLNHINTTYLQQHSQADHQHFQENAHYQDQLLLSSEENSGNSIELEEFGNQQQSKPLLPLAPTKASEALDEERSIGGEGEDRTHTMSKGGSRKSNSPRPPQGREAYPASAANGATVITNTSLFPSSSPMMNANSNVELRRKNPSLDLSTSASQTENLMERDSFSLDHDHSSKPSSSFLELSLKDQRNFLLLVLLYFLQGIPMGLASGSVPFLLKKKLSFAQIGTFTLAAYPYSMKLAWSPVVDAIWSTRFGRRKSWIVPIQACSGLMLIWLGGNIDWLMDHATDSLGTVTAVFFGLVFLCATQDIAVDGILFHCVQTY